MTVKGEEGPGTAPADATAAQPSRRSELDHTKRNVGWSEGSTCGRWDRVWLSGASDDDPSGATYSQAGAPSMAWEFSWTALLTLPLMAAVQEIADRTALATGAGLASWPSGRAVLAVLPVALIVANGLNIAADLVSIGSGMQLLHAGPEWLWALVAGALITTVLVLGSFARIALGLQGAVRRAAVLHGAPGRRARHDHLAVPVLLAKRPPPRGDARRTRGRGKAQPLKRQAPDRARRKQSTSRLDVFTGMTFSDLVMFAISMATAQTLHAYGKTSIQSAAPAADALSPSAATSPARSSRSASSAGSCAGL